MESFAQGQRVKVKESNGIALNAVGTVRRIRSDGGAFIDLDVRSKVSKVHPWSASDARGTSVLAYPEHCEIATKNHKDRRAKEKDEERSSKLPLLTVENFGKDHWSTFGYIETRNVDYGGVIAREKMRCHNARHPLLANEFDGSAYPTRLKGDVSIEDHDDWDCVMDLVAEGLLADVGTAVNPRFDLTPKGVQVASELRAWKAGGGNFHSFMPGYVKTMRTVSA